MRKKFFLFDSTIILYRYYHAFVKQFTTHDKLNDAIIIGFINTIINIIYKNHPTHIALIFDTNKNNIRNKIFNSYKKNRKSTPINIIESLPIIYKIIDEFNINKFTIDNYEADDVIGSLVNKIANIQFHDVYIVTNDKDLDQLSSHNVFLYKLNSTINNHDTILKKWNIKNTQQITDILGLSGDASDNIPGIRGIGIKTAQKIIQRYESIENMFLNINSLETKIYQKVINNKSIALLSKKLATIITDINIDINIEKLKIVKPNINNIKLLLSEKNYNKLVKSIEKYNYIYSKNIKQEKLVY
ncbi:MAG: hypothetical protein IR527_00280 [Bacteroides sp.]|nr:MAG: hypothetical protein IR527_00280 [Bacteroides sp.]